MLKIAFCLSGHVRNLVQNYPNLKQYILDPYNPDIFISTWLDSGWRAEGKLELGDKRFKGVDYYSSKINQQQIIDLLQPKKYLFENMLDYEEQVFKQAERHQINCQHPKDRASNTIYMSMKLHSCNELKKQYEQENNFIYDMVIRSRPDMVYSTEILNEQILKATKKDILFTANEESYGKGSDILAVGSSKTIDIYSDLYNHLDYMNGNGYIMSPHHLLESYYNIKFPNKWFKIDFGIKLNRCRKTTCGNQYECSQCDPTKCIVSNIFDENDNNKKE